ncbi:hypothetical protein A3Q56_06342 [Intoshia linei]|uniref:SAP domain-containing protein n=1 Tax=Intoshia linei TaxID=1819745 RepID=A0A177AVD3_9BILA|nr:hypothetical protein A3Q56_06342 [Intoshia linei]
MEHFELQDGKKLKNLTVAQLKTELKANSLSTTGNKKDLQLRLWQGLRVLPVEDVLANENGINENLEIQSTELSTTINGKDDVELQSEVQSSIKNSPEPSNIEESAVIDKESDANDQELLEPKESDEPAIFDECEIMDGEEVDYDENASDKQNEEPNDSKRIQEIKRDENGKLIIESSHKEKFDSVDGVNKPKTKAATWRDPTPPKNEPSLYLHISNLRRPFLVAQLKNFLRQTGNYDPESFWIDDIKTHCFVKYDTIEEAEETRFALHGLIWPISNRVTLIADFASEEEYLSHKKSNEPSDLFKKEQEKRKIQLATRRKSLLAWRTDKVNEDKKAENNQDLKNLEKTLREKIEERRNAGKTQDTSLRNDKKQDIPGAKLPPHLEKRRRDDCEYEVSRDLTKNDDKRENDRNYRVRLVSKPRNSHRDCDDHNGRDRNWHGRKRSRSPAHRRSRSRDYAKSITRRRSRSSRDRYKSNDGKYSKSTKRLSKSLEKHSRSKSPIHKKSKSPVTRVVKGVNKSSVENKIHNTSIELDISLKSKTDDGLDIKNETKISDRLDFDEKNTEPPKNKKSKLESQDDIKSNSKKKDNSKVESDKEDNSGMFLDNLFKKTKALPAIYWLPVTEQQTRRREKRLSNDR